MSTSLNSPSRTNQAFEASCSSATPGHSISVPGSLSRSMMRFTASAATILSGMPVLCPSPWPGAPSMIGSAIGHARLLRRLRDAVDVGAERDDRLAAAPGGHPGGRDAGDAALHLEAVLLEHAGEVPRGLDLLHAQLPEAEHRVHHLLRHLRPSRPHRVAASAFWAVSLAFSCASAGLAARASSTVNTVTLARVIGVLQSRVEAILPAIGASAGTGRGTRHRARLHRVTGTVPSAADGVQFGAMQSRHFHPVRRFLVGLLLGASSPPPPGLRPLSGQTPAATVFEGARLIDGTGGPAVDNAAIVVSNGRITAVGRAGQVTAPAGATRVSLAGKTVIPALVDAHVHTATVRDQLVDQLRAKAYFGVSAVLSMGLDNTDAAFTVRNETIPGAARLKTAGRGITAPEPGRTDAPYWVTTEAEARKAVQELAARKVDVVKIWVDDRDGKFKKLTPDLYGPVIDEAHKHKLRVSAHIFALEDAKGLLKAGVDIFAHGVRDRDIDDEFIALVKARPNVVLIPNMPDRGVPTDLAWLTGSIPAGSWRSCRRTRSRARRRSRRGPSRAATWRS